jgi:hypothetical protein
MKSHYLCKVLRDKVLKIVRKCLILVEIAKLSKKYIQGTEDGSYMVGCSFCAYIQVFGDT